MSENRLLIVDDDPDVRRLIDRVAQTAGYATVATCDPAIVDDKLRSWEPSHVLLDLKMPDTDGVQMLRSFAEKRSKARIVMISGVDPRIIDTAQRLGRELGLDMAGMLHKPFRVGELRRVLDEMKSGDDWLTAAAIGRAIEKGELFMVYQPKVDIRSGAVAGFEALLRWQHPTHGVIPPARFIPLAESGDLMETLTQAIMVATFRQMAAWREHGFAAEVAINLSPVNLRDVNFADHLLALAREHGVEPASLTLELTETAATSDAVKAMDILARLRLHDVKLSIDDFGTGHSSLVQLQRLPFSEIKIDRSFVAECHVSREARVIVKTIIDLAHNLGMRAVAEGVENSEIATILQTLGCDSLQGYHIARPLPAEQVPQWTPKALPAAQSGAPAMAAAGPARAAGAESRHGRA